MAKQIPFTKYIKITSGVGGGNNVATRQFVARLFVLNPLVSPNSALSFSSADDVGTYFGTSSFEYQRALMYFSYISPSITRAKSLQFARWAKTDSPARVFSNELPKVLATLKAITAGVLTLKFGTNTVPLTGITFAAATSLSDVAAELQTALRLNAAAELTSATVVYEPTTSRFNFTASPTGVTNESFFVVQAGAGATDVGSALGFYETDGAVWTDAQIAQEPVDAFNLNQGMNNNFGSFTFATSTAEQPTLPQHLLVAAANKALNVMFMYQIKVSLANASGWSAALSGFGGTGLTYEDINLNQFAEQIPMAIQAAIDYTRRNGAGSFMYRQVPGISPSVGIPSSAADYATLDALAINYYGVTQTAGQQYAFYQDGVLMGLATDPRDMNVYAGEQWLKDFMGAQIISGQLSLDGISANASGRATITALLQPGIDAALNNGVISVGKTLNATQQLFITEQTGDNTAYIQVQNNGWWLEVDIQSYVNTANQTAYRAVYVLIYSKNDLIRSVEGTHELI